VAHSETVTKALVDRFAQHCHVIDIDAESWRSKEATIRTERMANPKKR
jgi:DNA replication protein DnaC